MACVSFMFLGDSLLSVNMPMLQVRPDVGYPHSVVVYVVAGLQGVGVEGGR